MKNGESVDFDAIGYIMASFFTQIKPHSIRSGAIFSLRVRGYCCILTVLNHSQR